MMDHPPETNGLLTKIVREEDKMYPTIIRIMNLKTTTLMLMLKEMLKLQPDLTNTILVLKPKEMNIQAPTVISTMILIPLRTTGLKLKLGTNGKMSRIIGTTKEKLKPNLKQKLSDMEKPKPRVIMMDQSTMLMEIKEVELRVPINTLTTVQDNTPLKEATNINTIK